MVRLSSRKIEKIYFLTAFPLLILVLFVSTALWKLDWKSDLKYQQLYIFDEINDDKTGSSFEIKNMTIASIACGASSRSKLVVNMMKSATLLTTVPINFVVFADNGTSLSVKDLIKNWPKEVLDRIRLDIHSISFPPNISEEFMKRPFQPCAAQKLFLPTVLDDVDSLLYVDTDIIFLTSPEKVWEHLTQMNSEQMMAVAPEHENYTTSWYRRHGDYPYYGATGLNSGVMLMNLTKMRTFGFEKVVVPIFHKYKALMHMGDQDTFNIFFHDHPEKLYEYPCHFNFRPDHCTGVHLGACKSAEENGVYVLHGNRYAFQSVIKGDYQEPAFKAVYSAFEEFEFSSKLENLLNSAKKKLEQTTNTSCGKMSNYFTRNLEAQIHWLHRKAGDQ